MKPKKQKIECSEAFYNENHSSGVIKTSPGVLYFIYGITLESVPVGSYYLQLFNYSSLPKEGTIPDQSFKIEMEDEHYSVGRPDLGERPQPIFNFSRAMSWCISSEPNKKKITNPIFETLSFLYV